MTKQWLYDSLESDGWKETKDYIDPLAKEGIRRRREKGKGLLTECGPVYVCKGTKASREEIESVIRAAGGSVTRRKEGAWLGIGETKGDCISENAFYESIVRCELVRKESDRDDCESEEFCSVCHQETRVERRSRQNGIELITVHLGCEWRGEGTFFWISAS